MDPHRCATEEHSIVLQGLTGAVMLSRPEQPVKERESELPLCTRFSLANLSSWATKHGAEDRSSNQSILKSNELIRGSEI